MPIGKGTVHRTDRAMMGRAKAVAWLSTIRLRHPKAKIVKIFRVLTKRKTQIEETVLDLALIWDELHTHYLAGRLSPSEDAFHLRRLRGSIADLRKERKEQR